MKTLLLEHLDQLISTPEDVEKLNRSILHLAMQGKLVAQDAKDEPASELMKRIKAGNTKQNQSLSKIEEHEHPFELPHDWEWVRLGELCRLENGDRSKANYPNKTVLVKEGVPFVNASHLVNGRIDPKSITFITKERFDRLRSGKFANGDILFCLRGSLGKSALVEGFEAGAIASSLVILKIHPYLSPYYFLNYLDSPLSYEMIRKYDNGTAQPNLSAASLAKFLIPLPPLAEQQRIVARVEELFVQTRLLSERLAQSRAELDRLNQSALAHLLASQTPEEFNERWAFISEHFDLLTTAPEHIAPLRQSILELAVRGKLTCRQPGDEPAKELLKRIKEEKEVQGITQSSSKVTEEEITFQLPKGWEWTRWDDVSQQIADVDHKMPDEVTDGIPYVSPRDFKGKEEISFSTAKKISREDYDNLASKIRPERGDIIFPRYGTIGVNRFVSVEFEFLASYSCAIIKHMKGLMNPRYVYFYSISPFLKQETQKYINKTTQANVGIKSIQKFVFPLPPLAEQERIVKRVEQLLSWCDALEGRLADAARERGRLVESVLAGVGGKNGE